MSRSRLHVGMLLLLLLLSALSSLALAEPGASKEAVDVFLGDEALPRDEGGCMEKITAWLDRLQWSGDWSRGSPTQKAAFDQLVQISGMVSVAPWLALGIGQALLLYFWWGEGLAVNVDAGRLSLTMHLASIQYVGCNIPDLPFELFEHNNCPWRWRHAAMLPAELGIILARREHARVRLAAELFREATAIQATMLSLPQLAQWGWPSASAVNTNAFTYPGPVNRPIWPRGDVPLATFLEAHADTFRSELDALLDDNRFQGLYWGGEVSLTQFAPRLDDWQMVSLVKNRKKVDRVCQHAPRSCELLATRPEIMQCAAGDAGAAFARLSAGSGLRPHFWNSPRLGFHLGLRTPFGASMYVGGERVTWDEGKATVFDDTYVHSVLHEGDEPRYLLIGWFCHPCDRADGGLQERPEPLCP